jgi:hypothetical protein
MSEQKSELKPQQQPTPDEDLLPHEDLARAALAYENPDFLNSADGRLVRILSEYLEPTARFRRERIQDTVVFFGSARFIGLDAATAELQLLENTGSAELAPADEQHSPAKVTDRIQKHILRPQIQVVRRLVQQQEVRR